MNKGLKDKFEELSKLSRETKGASFVIQHIKDTGLYKVVFPNLHNEVKFVPNSIDKAVNDAIRYLKHNRKPLIENEKYTLL